MSGQVLLHPLHTRIARLNHRLIEVVVVAVFSGLGIGHELQDFVGLFVDLQDAMIVRVEAVAGGGRAGLDTNVEVSDAR